jgi:hypothetical protein
VPTAILTLRSEPFYRRDAFASGLKRLGYAVELADERTSTRDKTLPHPESRDDLWITWNLKAGPQETAAREWQRRGGTVLVTENAYLQRTDKSAYAISVGGHCGAGFFPVDQAEDRFTPLGFPLESRGAFRGHVLVCGQRGVGSLEMASPSNWGANMARELSIRHPDREVRYRPHPGVARPRVSLEDDLDGASLCVIWSSACGVRALTMGIPVAYKAPHWICADAGQTDTRLSSVAPLYDLKPALNRMAHGQWSVAEIETGEPFARMRAARRGRA